MGGTRCRMGRDARLGGRPRNLGPLSLRYPLLRMSQWPEFRENQRVHAAIVVTS